MGAATQTTTEIYFNPWDESFRANPYPHYKQLYARPPYLLNLFMPMALVARYADVATILRDHERFSSKQPRMPEFEQQDLFGNTATVLFSDPPTHTRLRRLVSRAFTPKRIKDLEPRIREITDGLLDRAEAKGELEIMADLATPLPVMVIAEMLGVSPQEYGQFKHWSDRIIEGDNTPPGLPLPADVRGAYDDLGAFFAQEIERRRKEPGADLVTALVAAHEESDALTAEELQAFVVLLLLAGNETTTNLIGNGTLALGRHPQQMAQLVADRSILPRAIEEMLRYDGPVQSTVRYNKDAAEVGGTVIPAASVVFVILAAANRDPAQFTEADTFDITRENNQHVAFGDGIHFCLGAALARLESQIAFDALLKRFPKLRLAQPEAAVSYKGSYFLRGLAALPMAIR
jgi:cytochrome P450